MSYKIKYVNKDMESLFEFAEPANSIMSVGFVSRLNGGQTKAVVEILKDTSTLVKTAPVGEVYKNMNIWVGDSKFPSAMINDVFIKFKVERTWVISNDHDPKLIKLCRYSDGMWSPLETSEIDKDEDYFYYEAKAPGFSQFAIMIPDNSKITMIENSSPFNEDSKMSIADNIILDKDKDASQDSKGSLLLLLLVGLIVVVAVVGVKYRSHYDKYYTQFANLDGKRYRRIKK
ncbi:MAG: PGF-pre-PGF domain-containing protein [Methanolobus sp.]|nr:PGF-pre-PGF domain-containing protein [Methanolobus sp.]